MLGKYKNIFKVSRVRKMIDYGETKIIETLNKKNFKGGNFIKSNNRYEHYDAENLTTIIEIKVRYQDYDKFIIERYKYERNIENSLNENRNFIYVVNYHKLLYIWDINYLDSIGYNYLWKTKKLARSTHFRNNNEIDKAIGYLEKRFSISINL
tara:strand:- start:38 stop:496 length:459 start_codon:yes stop_codon:yes gene_type:complete